LLKESILRKNKPIFKKTSAFSAILIMVRQGSARIFRLVSLARSEKLSLLQEQNFNAPIRFHANIIHSKIVLPKQQHSEF